MSCYLRNMEGILGEAGIVITPSNRKQVDQAIHQAVGVTYKSCLATWKKIKGDVTSKQGKRHAFIKQLQIVMR